MNPRVSSVHANNDHTLMLLFANGERRSFDVKPYLGKGIFRDLDDISYFKSVKVEMGTVAWPNGQDFCPDTLYEESIPISYEDLGIITR